MAEFLAYSDAQLGLRNDLLKRSYLKNHQHEQPAYLIGSYRVLEVRPLAETEVFAKGWVLRARATDFEDVDMEFVMPGLAAAEPPCAKGDVIKLEKRTYAALLHVQRHGEDRVCATVVPLAYQTVVFGDGKSRGLEPPDQLNIGAAWPLTRDPGPSGEETAEKAGLAVMQP
jgi:hypothetical protein